MANLGYGTYYSDPNTKPPGPVRTYIIIGVVIAALIGIGLFIATLLSSNAKKDFITFALHENSTLQIVEGAKKEVRNDTLQTANSNAAILIQNDVTSLLSALGEKGLAADQVKLAADTTNSNRLTQAGLLDKYDITYQQIMADKLASLLSEANTLRSKASSTKVKTALDKIIVNLTSISKQFQGVTL